MSDRPFSRTGLPPLALALIYAGAVLVPLVASSALDPAHRHIAMQAAAATGTISAGMILLQMVSSGRFEAISGRIGIDVTMAFHKWAAPVALVFALAHLAFVVGLPDPERPGRLARRIDWVLTGETLGDARIALILLALLIVLALLRDRLPWRYQVWRASHALGAVALVALVVWHVIGDGHLGPGTAALWVLFAAMVTAPALWVYAGRLTRPASDCWTIAAIRKVADRIWEVTLDNPQGRRLPFRAGQFAWASFGGRRLPLHDHPFSIASAPLESQLRLLVQEAGDFTRTVGRLKPGTRVGLDAPHGSFGPHEGTGPLLLIAGGVGIAPVLSVLNDLAARGAERPVRFAYAAREPSALVEADLYRPALDRLGITPMLLVDRGAPEGGTEPGPLSRVHLERLMQGLDPRATEALICGPGPMMTTLTDRLDEMGVPLSRIGYERFSYGGGSLSRKDLRMLGGFALLFAALAAAALIYSLAGSPA